MTCAGDVPPGCLVAVVQRRRLQHGDPAPQLQRAEPGKVLGQRDTVELRADPRLHAAQRLGEADDRIGQRGDLGHALPGGFVARVGLEDRRIALHRRGHVGPQIRRGGVEVERILRRHRLGGGERRDQARRRQTGAGSPDACCMHVIVPVFRRVRGDMPSPPGAVPDDTRGVRDVDSPARVHAGRFGSGGEPTEVTAADDQISSEACCKKSGGGADRGRGRSTRHAPCCAGCSPRSTAGGDAALDSSGACTRAATMTVAQQVNAADESP